MTNVFPIIEFGAATVGAYGKNIGECGVSCAVTPGRAGGA